MKYRRTSRLLSIVLLVAMLLTLMPATALAEDAATTTTWTQASLAELTADDTVAITMKVGDAYYVLPTKGSGSNGQPLATETGTVDGTTLTTDENSARLGWTITAADGGYTIANAGGNQLYVTATNNGVRINTPPSVGNVWSLDSTGAYLTAADSNGATRYLGIYNSTDWRCYTSINNNIKDQTVGFWKLASDGGSEEPAEPTISPIADALAAESGEFMVQGVVTFVDGRNVYVQDATGAICLFFGTAPTDIALGDTLIGTGSKTVYRGLPELSGASYEKSEGMSLSPKATTIGALTEADICSYVTIEKLTVTAVNGSNIDVQDEAGATIQIYKAVTGENTYAAGDVINFTGAVGIYNSLQLRNTEASEISLWTEPETPAEEYTPIAEALAASEGEFTVKGVVTLVDGKNIYVQDATGGICLYFDAAPTDIALGDTLIGTGSKTVYRGLPELSGASFEKSEGLSLEPKTATISGLTTADVCTYVSIEELTVTAVNGSNIDVQDDTGAAMQIYKAVTGENTYAVDDVINFTGAVGIYNDKLQLRNTVAEEISLVPSPEPELELPENSTVVLFTNDVHCGIEDGWGYAGVAALKKALEAKGNTVFLVDAGDHVQGGPIGTLSEGAYIIDIMNFVGYDMAIPGNHEYDYGMARFFENVAAANFPYVSANFMNYVGGEPTSPVLDAYKIFEANGKKIAFVGLSTPESITKSTPTYFQDEDGNYIYGFCQDPTGQGVYDAAQAAVDAARADGADLVVLVGHLGIDEQSSPWTAPEIIANLSGVDVVIDGHSHSVIDAELTDKDGKTVPHGQTGTKLANIGMLTIGEDGLDISLLPAEDKLSPDPEAKAYIDGIKAQYESLLNEVVAYTAVDLTVNDPDTGLRAVRSAETNLGDLCADAYLNMLDADVAFVNGGGVRANIPAGDITFGQILNVHPFGNAACLVEVSGQQILDALEMGSRVCPGENGGFLQVAGLTYEIHTSLEPNVVIDDSKMWTGTAGVPYRVQNVQVRNKETGAYEPLDLTKTYKLASHNYMLKSQGDGFAMFGVKNVTVILDEVMLDNKVLINYIQSLPGDETHEHVVGQEYSNPRGQGRITIVPYELPENSTVVLFTNDVHCGIEDGWGYAGLADLKNTLEARGNTVFLVDAGDHVQGGPIGTLSEGAYIIDIMNFVGYDMAIPGNHEFDYGIQQFFENVASAEFPYVAANFMNYVDGEPTTPVLDAYKIFEANGKKIAFVGLSTPESITKSTPTYFQDEDGNYIYGFCQDKTGEGLYTAAQTAVDAARADGADLVVLVGHLGIDEQSSPWTAPEIIANLSGVDVVIDGHSHSVIDTELTDKDGKPVLHGQTGTKLANIGMLVIGEESLDITLVPASDKKQDDPATAEYIAGIKAQYEALLQEVVAYTAVDLTVNDPDTGKRAVRNAETNLGDLCADAYLNMLDADVAFVNGGGVRANIPAGEITFGQILNVHPFGNAACLVEVSGQQILDALEMGARVCPGENGGFLQVAGLTYEIHTYLEPNVVIDDSKMWTGTAGVPYRVQNVQVLNKETGAYEPLDLTKTYRLASHNYMLKDQGDGFAMFGKKNVTIILDEVMLDNKVLINYIQSLPGDGTHEHVVGQEYSDPRGQGRITIVSEKPVEPETVTLSKMAEAPVDGDQLVIFYPAGNQVLTAVADGRRLKGTAATPAEDAFALTEEMAYMTAHVADGVYTFELDGQFLTSAEAGNGLSFAADGESDLAKWTLERQTDGTWYLMNVGANYNGNHNQALEYYNGFTTYGVKADNPIYKFEFYGPAAEPEKTGLVTDLADLTDGSYVVIYNPGNALALTSDTYQDWYLLGAEAAISDNEVAEPAANQIWKVTVNEDGSYTFTQNAYTVAAWLSGNYVELTNNGAYNAETDISWNLESCNPETSTFYMSSSSLTTGYGNSYIEVYGKKVDGVSGVLVFCGYSTSADKLTEKAYGMQFYLVPAPADQPVEPDGNTYGLTSTLADGDTVILYNAASGTALGNSLTNYKVSGVAMTPAEGVITTDNESVAWKVTANADGTYSFTQGDLVLGGSVRESNGKTYNNITLTGATYTNWTLTGPDEEDFNYYLYLGEMAGGNYDHVYLEYYSGYTLYAQNESGVNKNAYGITFYKQGAEAEVPSGGGQPGDTEIKVGTLVTSKDQLTDGATVLIYSPTHKTAASSVPNGDWYIKAVGPVTDSFTAPLVWTVTKNEDGTYKFSNGENVLSAWLSGNYVELTVNPNYNAETVSTWHIDPCNAATNTWFICNSTLTLNGSGCYVEAFLKNGTEVFSGFSTGTPTEDNYGLQFYLVDPADASEETDDGTWDKVLNKGSSYVIYNASAEGVLGIPNDMGNAMTNVPATIAGGRAQVTNGALVFTVADNPGRYYVLEVGGKYLATNNAEELFFSDEINEYTKWYLTKNGSGYILYNKTANYNGNPVCIEFFSGSFSGWTFKSTDADIFRFNFYPVADGTAVVNGVAQVPDVIFACEDARYVEQDYEVKFTLDDLAPEIASIDITYTVGDVTNTVTDFTAEGKTYTFSIPAADLDVVAAESFTLTVQVTNSYNLSYQGVKTVTILDEPFIGKLTPAANAQTMENKRPVISAEIGNVGENAVFTMTVNDEPVDAVFAEGVLSYQAAEDMADGRYTVIVTVTRADGKSAEKMWSFYVGKAEFQLYFGQLHSHTTYSDGSGSLEAALDYIAAIPKSDNIQFVAFTDHSNYFDSTSAANPEAGLYDVSQMTAASQQTWKSYKDAVAAFNARQSDVVAIGAFEMTWSGGPGHINTFNTPGIVSRNNATLNNKTNDAGMKAYYALLDNEALADSLSQFNHPGKTFGNFVDFSYWDAVTDSRIYLVEVGNGEGQIGAGGYYPSYEQYIMALDKGWHVAPTNNQDNHKGRWGNANAARDVILTDDFSEQGLYNAIKLYRVYATEDKNLEIQYTVNGEQLGTIFSEIPEELNFSVSLYDPDSSDTITKVELVANSGAVAYTWTDANEIATGLLETTLPPTYSYYFVRVTQADGDLAVTAPVWVGESLKLGISSVECGTSTPVTGEEFTLTTTFFNSESSPATIKSIVYTVNGSEVIGTDANPGQIPASSTSTVDFKYTPTKAKIMTITVTAVVDMGGVEYTFSKDIELEVKDADALVYIGIDASHYNEYVSGNYKDSMGNFGALAGGYGVRTVELKTSEELIEACSNEKFVAIIFTAPSRRLPAAQSDPKTYSEDELAAIAAFNAAGGQVIVSGWGDNYENYNLPESTKHMAQTQNELLAALGSSIRLGDDEVMDNELNGGQAQRLYFDAFNFDSYLMAGVIVDPENPNDREYSEVYSNYGGCSVYFEGEGVPATVTPIVYGHATTFTQDCDGDGKNDLVYPYQDSRRVVVMASEQLDGKGLIIVAGAAFMSNFEVQAAVSSGSTDADNQKNYANYKICENLVKGFNEVKITDIAEVQAQTEIGLVYTIEGVVTSNASGYDKDTAFFDCIYVQDDTAGICCFPVSGNFKIGDVVRITGYTDFYQAEMELQVMSIEKIGETDPVEPKEVTAAQINDLSVLGSLVTLKGNVESFEYENGLIQTIMVRDPDGVLARVFIDGYITTTEDVQNLTLGCWISATGLSSYDDTWKDTNYFPRIRVRNRADIICTAAVDENAAVVYGRSLSLKGKIALNVYLVLPESVTSDADAYVTIGDEKLPVSKARTSKQGDKTCYVFTSYVKFSQLTEQRVVRVYTGEDALVTLLNSKGENLTETGYVFCAQDYIESIRANSTDEKLLTLVNALSDVGSLAQLQFNYNVDTRAEVVGDLSAVTADTVSAYAPVVQAESGLGVSYYGSSLLLTEQTQIRHYFTVNGGISQFTFKVDGKTVQPVKKGSYYYIEINNVVAKDLNRVYHVEVSSASSGVIISMDYSALSYVYKTLSKGENSTLADLLKALTLYSQAADAYFGA